MAHAGENRTTSTETTTLLKENPRVTATRLSRYNENAELTGAL
jgi:hypothetical protein